MKATTPSSKLAEEKQASQNELKECALNKKEDLPVPTSTGVAAAPATGGADVILDSASRSSAGFVGRATRDTARDWSEALTGKPQAGFERPPRFLRQRKT